jgi:hypothetical protein
MDEQIFNREMTKAQELHGLGEKTDYWMGYMRGLRRKYYGDKFGTDEEHQKWLSLINDEYRKDLGYGYRDGFNLDL